MNGIVLEIIERATVGSGRSEIETNDLTRDLNLSEPLFDLKIDTPKDRSISIPSLAPPEGHFTGKTYYDEWSDPLADQFAL